MKKVLFVLLLLSMVTVGLFAETYMDVVASTDDFGDETGDKYLIIASDTLTFSNSATLSQDGYFVGLYIYPSMKSIACAVLEYSFSGVETFYDDKISIAYKAGDNASKSFKVDSSSFATFALQGTRYDEIINAMKSNSKIQFVVKGTEYQTSTKFNFTFEYDKDEFNKLLSQFE